MHMLVKYGCVKQLGKALAPTYKRLRPDVRAVHTGEGIRPVPCCTYRRRNSPCSVLYIQATEFALFRRFEHNRLSFTSEFRIQISTKSRSSRYSNFWVDQHWVVKTLPLPLSSISWSGDFVSISDLNVKHLHWGSNHLLGRIQRLILTNLTGYSNNRSQVTQTDY